MDNKQSVSLRVVLAFSKNLVNFFKKICLLYMKFSLKLKFSWFILYVL